MESAAAASRKIPRHDDGDVEAPDTPDEPPKEIIIENFWPESTVCPEPFKGVVARLRVLLDGAGVSLTSSVESKWLAKHHRECLVALDALLHPTYVSAEAACFRILGLSSRWLTTSADIQAFVQSSRCTDAAIMTTYQYRFAQIARLAYQLERTSQLKDLIDDKWSMASDFWTAVYSDSTQIPIFVPTTRASTVTQMITRIIRRLYCVHELAKTLKLTYGVSASNELTEPEAITRALLPLAYDAFPRAIENPSHLQETIIQLYKTIFMRQLAHDDGVLLAMKTFPKEGGGVVQTRYWEPMTVHRADSAVEKVDIESFVRRLCSTDNPETWGRTFGSSVVSQAITELTRAKDHLFPELQNRDMVMISFRNGVFVVKTCQFLTYEELDASEFSHHVSSQYFDQDFPADIVGQDPMTIECAMDPLIRLQSQSMGDYGDADEVVRWFYAMLGRMMFKMDVHDHWQVFLVVFGNSGTGKSTIVSWLNHLFGSHLREVTNTTVQNGFGIGYLVQLLKSNVHCVIFDEWTNNKGSDFGLNEQVWKTMASGGRLDGPVKNQQKPVNEVWNLPVAMFGNSAPSFAGDSADAVGRRMVIFPFLKIVPPGSANGDMLRLLKLDTPRILYKCVRAYLDLAKIHGSKLLWSKEDLMPRTLVEARKDRLMSRSPCHHFIARGKVARVAPGSSLETMLFPYPLFQRMCNDHARENQLGKVVWTNFETMVVPSLKSNFGIETMHLSEVKVIGTETYPVGTLILVGISPQSEGESVLPRIARIT